MIMQTVINIYQIFTRLFANQNETNQEFGTIKENGCSKFNDITSTALNELKRMGVTHVWYTGVIRHASCTNYSRYGLSVDNPHVVKGRAGSPYAIKDYFDVDPDLATNVKLRMKEYEDLIARTHDAGLQCIMDFVPNHVSREYSSDNLPLGGTSLGSYDDTSLAFSPNNNFYYIPDEELHLPDIQYPYTEGSAMYYEYPARVTGNDVFNSYPSKNDWYETIKLNYGVDYKNTWQNHFEQIPDTWIRMQEILSFWAQKGVDGFRCDMAEMVPVQFWGWVIPQIKEINPNCIFIAEIYNPDAYVSYLLDGHFDYLYDKVGLYDTMRLIVEGKGIAKYISDYWKRSERVVGKMLRFLENHDEQRIASRFFANDGEKAKAAMEKAMDPVDEAVADAEKELNRSKNAQKDVSDAISDLTFRINQVKNGVFSDRNTDLTEAKQKLDELKADLDKNKTDQDKNKSDKDKLDADMEKRESDYKQAKDNVKNKERALEDELRRLDKQKQSDGKQQIRDNISQRDKLEEIEEQRALVEELSDADNGTEVRANVSGKIQSLSVSAGHKAEAGNVLATIEVPDLGYGMSFTVTTEQARRLKVGDSATVSNFYWGSQIVATLASIQTDPQNPQGSRILNFDVTGDVTAGNSLTISVGEKNANYDMVVPNSAVRSDTNGSFVLMVTAKNSPLGNRYFASRVNVEVVASDDQYSAISGAIEAYDSVITTASRNAPISSGDQVRLADSNN